MRIAIVTDAWTPQVNGVVRTYQYTRRELSARGHCVHMVTPDGFRTLPCPGYPSIPLAIWPWRGVREQLESFSPQAVHIATEGPLGHAARRWCMHHQVAFTTSFHTQFPEYVRARLPLPVSLSYRYVRRFHSRATRTLVPTPSQRERLIARGFRNLHVWTRGVDTELFSPARRASLDLPRPIALFVGRVSIEKNIEAFLTLRLPGSKVVIGDGPDLDKLKKHYPRVHFLGQLEGETLARHIAAADVFVFPSLTDTFGIVLLEAMACGVPVAAFPVTGPLDVVCHGRTGILDWDLKKAVLTALELDPAPAIRFARSRSWSTATAQFASLLTPAQCAAD